MPQEISSNSALTSSVKPERQKEAVVGAGAAGDPQRQPDEQTVDQ